MSNNFNYSWINSADTTRHAASTVPQAGGIVFSFRQPSTGQVSSSDLNAAISSIGQNINRFWGLWKSNIRPILDSLPAGGRDTRWGLRPGKGLREEIDCLTYGIQGSTLFVFNDATNTKADGRYWLTDENRPKTIAEVLEDLNVRISNLAAAGTSTSSTTVDLEPLWAAIGHRYQSSTLTSLSTSLDSRVGVIEARLTQLNNDIYAGLSDYGLGTPLESGRSIAEHLDKLLKIHNVSSGWQNGNPANMDHSGIGGSNPPFTQNEVLCWPSVDTGDRSTITQYLSHDIRRLRWEINRTRGASNWQSDVRSPWMLTGNTTLGTHINYTGSGTASVNNPHGLDYTDTEADVPFGYVASFIGMSNYATNEMPNYSSNNIVTDGTSLEEAIGDLDAATTSAVVRGEYDVDRSSETELWREHNPIIIYHGSGSFSPGTYDRVETNPASFGKIPLLNVLDMSPEELDYYGMYSAWTVDANIVHLDANTIQIWTTAAIVKIIAMY